MNNGDWRECGDARKANSSDRKLRELPSRNERSSMASGFDKEKTAAAPQPDCLLTAPEAAKLLRLKNVGTIYHLVSAKRVPVIKLSARCIRFSRNALLKWLEEMSQPAE